MLDGTRMLLVERTTGVTRLYTVDFAKATNILGSPWDAPSTQPSLETTAVQTVAREIAMPNELIADLSRLPNPLRKIEGVALIDSHTVAVANDNDFDIGQFDADGNNIPAGVPSKILLVELATPLTR